MRYLLDTNILSDLIKNPHGKAARHIRMLKPGAIYTSTIVAGELHYGSNKKNSPLLRQRIHDLLAVIPVLSLEHDCALVYGKMRALLDSKGTPIGLHDLWIAAHAMTAGMILVTHNTREFSRVQGLAIEDWLQD